MKPVYFYCFHRGLEACEEFHNELLKCKRASVFYQCNNEANLFWNCMNTYIVSTLQFFYFPLWNMNFCAQLVLHVWK